MPIEIDRIAQIAIVVDDIERAEVFYRDQLGLTFLFDAPGLSFFDCNGMRLMITLPQPNDDEQVAPAPSSILYYSVKDVQAAYAALSADGVEFVAEPHVVHRTDEMELWMAFLNDPAGNTLALTCQVSLEN